MPANEETQPSFLGSIGSALMGAAKESVIIGVIGLAIGAVLGGGLSFAMETAGESYSWAAVRQAAATGAALAGVVAAFVGAVHGGISGFQARAASAEPEARREPAFARGLEIVRESESHAPVIAEDTQMAANFTRQHRPLGAQGFASPQRAAQEGGISHF